MFTIELCYIDINECQYINHGCSPLKNEECNNTPGSFFCRCKAGFKNSTLGMCDGKPTMYHKLPNFNNYYDLSPMRHISMTIIIIDINECETNQHNCSDRMNCRNTNGSYECTCKEGYNFSMALEEECQGIL